MCSPVEDDMMFDIEINVDGSTNQQQAATCQSSSTGQSASSGNIQGLMVPGGGAKSSKGAGTSPRPSPLPSRPSFQYRGIAPMKMEPKLKYHVRIDGLSVNFLWFFWMRFPFIGNCIPKY